QSRCLASGANQSNRYVAIGRTYADLTKFGAPSGYAFAPKGERTALDLVVKGIRQAKRTIYLEDQYLSSRIIRVELAKKLADTTFRHLLILLCNSNAMPSGEFPLLRTWRNEFRADFLKADPTRNRWAMYALKPCPDASRRPWCGEYVHSKTWIF